LQLKQLFQLDEPLHSCNQGLMAWLVLYGQYITPGFLHPTDFVANSLLSFAHLPRRSFDEAVVRAVNLNGDADSFGSMAGAQLSDMKCHE
jgi:ADP-ribosylglycohydrolase